MTLPYHELRAKYANGLPCPADFNFPANVIDKFATDPSLLALHWVSHDYKKETKVTYAQLADVSLLSFVYS